MERRITNKSDILSMKGDMNMLKRISKMMGDDGIRLQMEAELKREISDEEWMAEVEQWAEEIKDRMQMCSCSLEEAYKDITQ